MAKSPNRLGVFCIGAALLGVALLVLALYGPFRGDEPAAPSPGKPRAASPAALQWNLMSRVEELILELDQSLAELSFAVRNLELPDERSRALFMPLLVVEDLPENPDWIPRELESISARVALTAASPDQRDTTGAELRLWRPLLDEVRYFHHAGFRIESGRFLGGNPEEFEAEVVFSALARMKNDELASLAARPVVRWRQLRGTPSHARESWRIVAWRTGPVQRIDAPRTLFREVLSDAVPDPAELASARTSRHERFVAADVLARRAGREFEPPHRLFAHTAVSQHPAVAVVDVDRDGFDDFYVMTRWDRNRLFRNRGDGSFEEIAARIGVDVDSFSNAAIFADFDNDADLDLFLGRSLKPSVYLVNEGGRFLDRTAERLAGRAPQMVSSLSAVDYDGDGLLDLYASTYAVQLPLDEIWRRLDPADFDRFNHRVQNVDANPFLDVSGPPNVLLRNAGEGRFEVVRGVGPLHALRNTFQATWADFDGDGDPDVYLANDFAPDNLIRNDAEGGFVDISAEAGFSLVGFGMGSTWGDYDRDGRQDLYVSNMSSKAGTRITGSLDYLGSGFAQAARGNFLYRNEGSDFQLMSGRDGDDLRVERAGWSWGSQFLDADNDGFLDLFALAGFHTAPREVEIAGDT